MIKEFFLNNRIFAAKKTISIILILFGIFFVLSNRDVYYSLHSSFVPLEEELQENEAIIRFSGNMTFEQEFTGWNGTLEMCRIRFSNQGRDLSSGSVTVNILDTDGNTLQSAQKPLTQVARRTSFIFEDPKELSKNKTYVMQAVIRDARNPQGFGICTYTDKGELFGQLTQDGAPIDNRLRASFGYRFYNIRAMADMFILLGLALLFVFIPFERIDRFIEKRTSKKLDTNILMSRIFLFITPVLCIFLGDRFNDYHLSEMTRRIISWQFWFNLVIYTTLLLVIYVILNRVQYTCIIVLSAAFIMHIANYYVWVFRGCPILAADLQSAATAFNVADNFSYSLDLTGIWGVVYILSFTAMLLSLKGYKGPRLKQRMYAVGACVIYICFFNILFIQTNFVPEHVKHDVWKPQRTYAKNGNALSFLMSWSSIRIEKPKNYSIEEIEKITKRYPSDNAAKTTAPGEKPPNIIAIMDESLADLSYNSPIELSEDYLPFLHSLTENTVKGKLYVSIQGANTANSEFEFLTGNSMNFLPYRSIPYNEYIKDTTPSMAHTLKAQGYSGVNAYHPFKSSGWSRTIAYPALGFNKCRFQEYYVKKNNFDLVRNYISDEADFRQIIADYEASRKKTDSPFYLFNVTMQNHGGYNGKRGLVEPKITIKDTALNNPEAEQYINLAKMSDDAFKMLVEYFKKVDEPTLIVMFGDHQPPITNLFYNNQFGKDVEDLTPEEEANWYSTPYVIWANYDIEENELDMSANYLSSYVMNLAGNKLTGYNKYLLELQKELPAISAVCYMDKTGKIHKYDEKTEYDALLATYHMLQYNQMFDKEHRADDFFFLK